MKRKFRALLCVGLISTLIACNTSWVTEALNILKIAAPAVVNVLQLISAFTGTPVNQQQSATLTNDINAAIQLLTDYSAASGAAQQTILGQLNTALQTTQNDLQTLLTATHVSNPQHQAEIAALVTFIITEVTAVESLLPTQPGAAPNFKGAKAQGKLPLTARQFKAGFNNLIGNADPSLKLK